MSFDLIVNSLAGMMLAQAPLALYVYHRAEPISKNPRLWFYGGLFFPLVLIIVLEFKTKETPYFTAFLTIGLLFLLSILLWLIIN